MATRPSVESARWPASGHTIVEWTLREHLTVQRSWLSPPELSRAGSFLAPLGEHWAAARCWVRARLAHRLECHPGEVDLHTDARGRLVVAGLEDGQDVNVSHTEQVLVLALSADRVGVDVEQRPPAGEDLVALAQVVGTEAEVAELHAVPPDQRAAAFQRWWVRKEAVLKADGAGFLTDPRGVHVGVTTCAPPAPWTVIDHGALPLPPRLAGVPTLLATAHPTKASVGRPASATAGAVGAQPQVSLRALGPVSDLS